MKTLVWIIITIVLMAATNELIVSIHNNHITLSPVPTDVTVDEFTKYAQDDIIAHMGGFQSKYTQYINTYINPSKDGKLPLYKLHQLDACILKHVGYAFTDNTVPRIPTCITKINLSNNNDVATFAYLLTYFKN